MFFFDESLETFTMFSLSHLLAVAFWILAIALMIVFRKRLRGKPRLDRFIRWFLAIAMLTMQTIFYIWHFWRGSASLELLPFGLCHMAMYLSAATFLTDSEKLFRIVFPWAMIGAVLSLVVADLTFEFPHFRYLHYFGNHGMFLFGGLYMVFVKGYRITYRSLWGSGLILIAISVPVYFFNQRFGTNHLFLSSLPNALLPLQEIFGAWWLVGFVGVVFPLFHLVYLPFFLADRIARRQTLQSRKRHAG
jgi:hypothetical integral membrane protein (TIGR02206 family)